MFDKGKQHTRLCLLESRFDEFQKHNLEHNEYTSLAAIDFKKSIDSIIEHMDKASDENRNSLSMIRDENRISLSMIRDDIQGVMARESKYVTDIELRDNITALRTSMVADLDKERIRSIKEILTYIVLGTTIITLIGWVYINVIQVNSRDNDSRNPVVLKTTEKNRNIK